MDNFSKYSQWEKWATLPTYIRRVLKLAFAVLVFGAVFILLIKLKILVIDPTVSLEPIAFAGGAIVLGALTLLGVPLVPALIAGAAAWLVIQEFWGSP